MRDTDLSDAHDLLVLVAAIECGVRAYRKMDKTQRQIMDLLYERGRTEAELADRLNITTERTKTALEFPNDVGYTKEQDGVVCITVMGALLIDSLQQIMKYCEENGIQLPF